MPNLTIVIIKIVMISIIIGLSRVIATYWYS